MMLIERARKGAEEELGWRRETDRDEKRARKRERAHNKEKENERQTDRSWERHRGSDEAQGEESRRPKK